MDYDQYVAEWNGKQVMQYGGECVAGIAEYEAENNLPIVWGDAHVWINNPIMLVAYDWVVNDPNDPNQLPPRAAIIVFPLPNEHICFFDHNLENEQFMSFGQNSGGATMHMQAHNWANVAGWYVPKAVPVPVAPPYTIELIPSKQVKLNKDTHLWNLNYDNFTAIDANPQADALAGTLLMVRAILHHNIGYNYYLTDPSVPNGYNIIDCDDYVAPPPVQQLPAAPVVIPNSETYELIKDLPGYITANLAINHSSSQVIIPAGTYFVFNKYFDKDDSTKLLAINLTKTAGKPGGWIDVADNTDTPLEPVQPPEPTPPPTPAPDFKTTFVSLAAPEVYVAMKDLQVIDLAGTNTAVVMPKYSITKIVGSFTVNNIEYALPQSAQDKGLWYGVAWVDPATGLPNIELESDVFDAKMTLPERQATKTLVLEDHLALVVAHLKNVYLNILEFLAKLKTGNKNKKG